MNTRERRTKQEYALLVCGEYFRDELQFGATYSERQQQKFTELKALCFDALGDPSLKDADEIRKRFQSEATTCGIPVSEIIAEGGLYCLNCNEWRIVRSNGDVVDCPNCKDEGWNLYEDADKTIP